MTAAFRLFGQKGIFATRTIDVARAAGVAHGSIFVHFPKRDDLIAAVIEEFAGSIALRIHNLADREAGVEEILAAHLEGLAENEPFYTRLVMEGPLLPEYARSMLLSIQSAISFHLAGAVEREVGQQRIRPIPLHLLFNTWLGLVHHYVVNRDLFAPGESVLIRWGPQLLSHFMKLLTP